MLSELLRELADRRRLAGSVDADHQDDARSLADLALELGALATIGLAAAAVVQHHTGRTGGPFSALIMFVGPVTMSALTFRNITLFPSVLPGSPLHERWAWLALIAAAALTFASRDPAHPRRG